MIKRKLMTKNGLLKLKKDLAKLEEQRPEAVVRLETARQMGDLRENSEYHAAREDLALLDTQIDELKEILVNIKIVGKGSNGVSRVGLESLVTVKNNGREITYQLVGEHESNPLKGKISYTSPLGKALMGQRVGDRVVAKTPRGKINYQIITIK
ncbi:MAG: transcription elongation factor GreA [Candidatus Shapirobacteria bacterium]|nr:transcription elongation factor GreA [Candidatus Shapirobacteria bacterium]